MKRYNLIQRIMAFALTLVLVIGLLPNITLGVTALEVDSRVSDPSTMDRWKDFFGPDVMSTEFSGGIWTDKSVFTDASAFPSSVTLDDPDAFLVALSAISSTTQIKGQSTTPTDTMLVLDLSNSMDTSRSIPDMIEATNEAIKTLLEDNIYSRVGVVLYSGNSTRGNAQASTATVILPLDRYTANSDGEYLTYTGSSNNTTVQVASGVENSKGTTVTGSKQTDGATYIQNGLFKAWQEFEAVTDTKVNAPGSSMDGVQRMPIIVLMSDGAPTVATTNYFGTTNNQGVTSIGTSNSGNGTSSNNSQVFLTQLTAAWVKASTANHYGTDAKFYTLGLGTSGDSNATGVLYPAGSNNTITGWWNSYLRLSDGSTLNSNNAPRVTRKSIVTAMNYVDQYWSATNSADLIQKFEDITGEIQLQSASYSTLVEAAGADLSGYVSFEDELGELMHIREVKGILLGDTLYTGREMAVAFSNGTFGAVGAPTEAGNEFTATMCERIGIDASTAHQLAQNAYAAKQLYYDASTGEYSNYIGWYSDANGDYLGFWQESYGFGTDVAPAGAVYINKSYGYLGENGNSDMMHVVVNTRMEIATSHQDVLFKVPANLLPMVTYQVELEGETLATGGTMERIGAEPIRLVYEVGLREDINSVNIDQKIEEYLQENPAGHIHENADGSYSFYTNQWGTGHGDQDPTYNTALLPNVTESHFNPAEDNGRYYYTQPTAVYVKQGDTYVLYTGIEAPSGTSYYYPRTIITADSAGKISVTTKFVQISESVLENNVSWNGTANQWQVAAGTVFQELTRFDEVKTSNNTGTLRYSDYPMVVVDSQDADDYNIYAVLGNNGKLTVKPAQGIRVSKTVAELSDDAAAPTKFDFVITLRPAVTTNDLNLTDADGNAYTGAYTLTQNIGSTVIELSLADGEEVLITGLPTGTEYEVEELQSVYYNTSYPDDKVIDEVKANEVTHVPFVNAPRELKELTITKTVLHPFAEKPAALANKEFQVRVTLTKLAAGHTFHLSDGTELVADENGSFVVTLKNESTVTIVDILEDTPYIVEEIDIPAGFDFVAEQSSGLRGILPGTAHVVNQYVPKPPVTNPDVTVTVNKKLTGDYDGPETFKFRLEMLDPTNPAAEDGYVLVQELEVDYPDVTSADYDLTELVKGFTTLGSHTFRIMEVTGTTTGMTYSLRRATFQVNVVDPEMDGSMAVEVVALTNTTVSQTEKDGGTAYTVSSEFENIYAVDSTYVDIPVSKTLINATGVSIDLTGFQFGLFENPTDTTPVNGYTVYAGPTGAAVIRVPVTNISQNGKVYYLKEIEPATAEPGMTYDPAVYKVTLNVSSHAGTEGAYLTATAAIVPYSGGGAVTDGNATFENTYDLGETSATLVGDKDLLRGYDKSPMTVAAGKYTFQLWTANADYSAGTLLQTVTNGADGSIRFEPIEYTAVGPYTYIIREVKGSDSAITYDSHDVYVMVNVTADGEGGLQSAVYYRKSNETSASQLAQFTNTYNVSGTDTVNVSGTKSLNVLQGEKSLTGGEFSFQLKQGETVLQTVTNAPNGSFSFTPLSFTAEQVGQTFTYTVVEAAGSNAGIDYDDTVYTFTVEVKDNGDGTIDAVMTLDGADSIAFVNDYTAKSTTASFSGTKSLSGRKTGLEAGEFFFDLYKADASFTNRTLLQESITHDADGNFSFETEEYTKTGYYYYVLTEQIPTGEDRPDGMHYDAGEYHLTVQVIDRGVGQLEVQKTVYKPGSSSTTIAFSNEYIPESVEVVLTAQKKYGNALTAGMFTFKLDSEEINLQTKQNAGDGTVTFDKLTFEKEGTYTYYIREVKGDLDYVVYDTSTKTVTITVTDNGEGQLEAVVTVDGAEGATATFENGYQYLTGAELNLTGSKTLTGRDMIAGEFEFVVIEDSAEVSRGTNNAAGVITFQTIEYTYEDIGKHTYTISEVQGEKGGVDYDDTTYTLEVEVADDGKGGLTVTRLNGSNDVILAFANKYTVTGTANLDLAATKVLSGRDLTAEDKFTFVLEDGDGKVLQTKQNDAEGSITFDTITYGPENIGTHYYQVAEVEGAANIGINYDSTVYYLVVTVADNGEGGITVSYTVNGGETAMVFTNTYGVIGEVSVPLSGMKTLTGDRTAVNDKEFTFILTDSDGKTVSTVQNRANGSFQFPDLKFTDKDVGKTFTYTVSEHQESKQGFTYSTDVFTVEITVSDNGQGGLFVTKKVGKNTDTPAVNTPIHFTNSYEITGKTQVTLTGIKNLTGRTLNDEEFTFHVHEGSETVSTGTNDENGVITFTTIEYTKKDIGTHTYVVHEVADDLGGVTYDTARHTVTVTVSDNGEGGLKAVVEGEESLVFKNTYKYSGQTEVTLSGTKSYNKTLEDGMFSFQLIEDGQVLQTVTNTGDSFTFEKLVYTTVGEHIYTICEVQESLGGVTYDQTAHQVTVKVFDNGEGGLSTTVTGEENISFTNTYSVSGSTETTIRGTKTLTGDRTTVKKGEFSFQLMEGNTVLQTVSNAADGGFVFKPLTYTADQVGQTFTYTVSEVDAGKPGFDYSKEVFTVNVEIKDNGDGSIQAIATIVDAQAIAFENTYTITGTGEVKLEGTKAVTGDRDTQTANEYKFVVMESTTEVSRGFNDENGKIVFDTIYYDKTHIGTHTYTVSEVKGDKGGITYSDAKYTVVVTVSDNGDGTLKVEKTTLPALDFTNTYTISGEAELTLTGTKHLEVKGKAAKTMQAGEFSFVVKDKVTEEEITTGTNAADGTITFETITYTKADIGEHTYTVSEVKGDNPGVTYDETTTYEVVVTVSDSTDGTLKVSHTVNGGTEPIVFRNTYEVTGTAEMPLSGVKVLTGRPLEVGEFSFTLSKKGADGQFTEVETVQNTTGGAINFTTLTFDPDEIGQHVYKVFEVDNDKGGVDYDTTLYTVVVTVSDNGKGGLSVSKTVNGGNNDIIFRNGYSTEGSETVTIAGAKQLGGGFRDTVKDQEFSFVLKDAAGTEIETVKNIEGGAFSFTALTFTQEHIAGSPYRYTVSEVKGDNNGMTYSDVVFNVTITVEDNLLGGIRVTKYVDDATDKAIVFQNTYTVTGSEDVILSGTKVLTGDRTTADDQEFSFVLKDAAGTEIETVKNKEDGTFEFSKLTFTQDHIAGSPYRYTVTEVDTGNTAVDYSEAVFEIVITVSDNEDGGITVQTKINGETDTPISFTNDYAITGTADLELTGTKTLLGDRTTQTAGEFEFVVMEGNEQVAKGTNAADGTITFEPIHYTKEDIGDHVYVVSEVKGNNNGMTYDEDTSYEVKVTVSDNGKGGLTVTRTADPVLSFTNTYTITGEGELVLEGTKSLSGRDMTDKEFHFVVMEGDKKVSEGTNNTQGVISFEKITYTKADIGEHTYVISEVDSGKGGVNYDTVTYTVKVKVSDNNNGGLTVERTADPKLSFANTYSVTGSADLELEGTKALLGRDMTAGEFTFVVMEGDTKVAEGTNDAQGKIDFSTITYYAKDIGEHTYVVSEVVGEGKGITYDPVTYTVKVQVEDNGEGGLTVTRTADPTIAFYNVYTPDLSVTMDVLKAVQTTSTKELSIKGFQFALTDAVSGQVLQTVDSDEQGKAAFGVTYTLADVGKTFTYQLSEVKGSKSGWTYDTTVYAVSVTVGMKQDGTLSTAITLNEQEVEQVSVTFTNTYTPSTTPGTGDSFQLALILGLLMVSGLGLGLGAVIFTRKRRTAK